MPDNHHQSRQTTTAASGCRPIGLSLKTGRTVISRRKRPFFQRKYLIDRWLGCGMLVVVAPFMVALYGLVRLTSRGPGFYRQKRVGLNGKVFEIIKLRSMVQGAEKPGQPVWCTKKDSRVTLVGKWLRTLHLDELPQLWNVACGDMSLIGPRPERPEICRDLADQIDGYFDRVSIKPGVTGLAQINLPPDENLEDVQRKQILDLRYIEEADAWLDLRILLATAMRMIGVKGETVMKSMGLCRRNFVSHVGQPVVKLPSDLKIHQQAPSSPPRFGFTPESEDSGVLI